jgi:hypothetical protein
MKAKRRSPITGPLLTFGLMLGSIGLVLVAAHYLESPQKSSAQTVATSSTASPESNTRQ